MPGRPNSAALIALAAALAAAPALPQTAPEAPPAEGIARAGGAVLRGLDKIAGRTVDLEVRVGEAVTLGRLEIRLGECRYRQDDPSADAWAELTITDTAKKSTVFSGWMIASLPAISALDDARYDVWVLACQSA